MNKKDQPSTDWKSEERRNERKERLAELKSQNGRNRTGRRFSWKRLLVIVTAAVLVSAFVIYALLSTGVPQRSLTIMSVNGLSLKVAEFNYWYGNILSQYGLTSDSPELDEVIESEDDGGMTTVRSFLITSAADQIQQVYAEASLAKEAGMELGEYQLSVDQRIDEIITSSGGPGLADMTLKQVYGPGCTLKVVRNLFENLYLATKYAAEKKLETDVSENALETYYSANADDLDRVDYRGFSFEFTTSDTATDVEKEEAKAEALKKAEAFIDAVDTENDFKELALETMDEEDREAYEEADLSKVSGKTATELTANISEWMFDDERQGGEMSVIENDTDYVAVYFLDRYRAETQQASVRHILVSVDEAATDEERAEALTRAEGIEAQVTTEESFTALVKANSDDVASLATGGLYSGITEDSSFVETFLEWSIDPDREVGETGIVETEYGYHVMYFVGTDAEWTNTVRSILQEQDYVEFIGDKMQEESFAYTLDSFALRFVN